MAIIIGMHTTQATYSYLLQLIANAQYIVFGTHDRVQQCQQSRSSAARSPARSSQDSGTQSAHAMRRNLRACCVAAHLLPSLAAFCCCRKNDRRRSLTWLEAPIGSHHTTIYHKYGLHLVPKHIAPDTAVDGHGAYGPVASTIVGSQTGGCGGTPSSWARVRSALVRLAANEADTGTTVLLELTQKSETKGRPLTYSALPLCPFVLPAGMRLG
eukprot:COSAG06_NODE_817_length_12118_cov_6.463683_3_plen_213_part_00